MWLKKILIYIGNFNELVIFFHFVSKCNKADEIAVSHKYLNRFREYEWSYAILFTTQVKGVVASFTHLVLTQ